MRLLGVLGDLNATARRQNRCSVVRWDVVHDAKEYEEFGIPGLSPHIKIGN